MSKTSSFWWKSMLKWTIILLILRYRDLIGSYYRIYILATNMIILEGWLCFWVIYSLKYRNRWVLQSFEVRSSCLFFLLCVFTSLWWHRHVCFLLDSRLNTSFSQHFYSHSCFSCHLLPWDPWNFGSMIPIILCLNKIKA